MTTKIGYMDKIDFEEELGISFAGVLVFPSVEALRANINYVDECGIVKVEVKLLEVIQETQFK